MISQSSNKLDLRPLKSFVREKLPRKNVLRKVLLTEKDEIDRNEFMAKIDVWLKLLDIDNS